MAEADDGGVTELPEGSYVLVEESAPPPTPRAARPPRRAVETPLAVEVVASPEPPRRPGALARTARGALLFGAGLAAGVYGPRVIAPARELGAPALHAAPTPAPEPPPPDLPPPPPEPPAAAAPDPAPAAETAPVAAEPKPRKKPRKRPAAAPSQPAVGDDPFEAR